MAKDTEACGRCSMSVVVDAVDDEGGDEERDPFGGGRIEVDEGALERATPEAWLSRVSSRLNDAVTGFVWRR
jgi:hypothetical protein